MDNNHNFYSVSSDGRVVSWTLIKVSQWNIDLCCLHYHINTDTHLLIMRYFVTELYMCTSASLFVCFTCLQNELVFTDIIRLSLNGAVSEGPDGSQQPSIGKVSRTQHVVLHMYSRMYPHLLTSTSNTKN